MNEAPILTRSLGVISTAALTLGTCGASATAFDSLEQAEQAAPQRPLYNLPFLDAARYAGYSNLNRFITAGTSASGANSIDLKFYTYEQLNHVAENFISNIRNHQVDLDIETKAFIAENLWDLYD